MAKIGTYIQEAADELFNKVSWPTWDELQNSSVIVLLASVIFAFVIFAMDYTLGNNGDDAWFDGLLGIIYGMFEQA
jgi:preprotein translocase subunit SecE